MFKYYKDLCDVVSVLIYCPNDKSYLLTKENNGEFWIPWSKVERNCWKSTANKIISEVYIKYFFARVFCCECALLCNAGSQ